MSNRRSGTTRRTPAAKTEAAPEAVEQTTDTPPPTTPETVEPATAPDSPAADEQVDAPLPAAHPELDGPGVRSDDQRPRCRVKRCTTPEFIDDAGLCGGHWATRPDLRKEARRGR